MKETWWEPKKKQKLRYQYFPGWTDPPDQGRGGRRVLPLSESFKIKGYHERLDIFWSHCLLRHTLLQCPVGEVISESEIYLLALEQVMSPGWGSLSSSENKKGDNICLPVQDWGESDDPVYAYMLCGKSIHAQMHTIAIIAAKREKDDLQTQVVETDTKHYKAHKGRSPNAEHL